MRAAVGAPMCWSPDWHVRSWSEVPLDVAQFDVWPGVAHDAAKFLRNVLWCKIQNQMPGYQLCVTKACLHVHVSRVDRVQESVLRVPVRPRVGHELVRKVWFMRVHSVALPPMDNLSTCRLSCCSRRDRDEGARGEDMRWVGPLAPPTLTCWNHAHSCLVQVSYAILQGSEAIEQVDDAQLQEFPFSGNVSLTQHVAGVSRRALP